MQLRPPNLNSDRPAMSFCLVEEGPVLVGELRLVGGKIGLGEDRVLSAEIGAAAAINAFVGVDEDLGNAVGAGIALQRRDGRRGALRHADKILDARVRHYVSHKTLLGARIRSRWRLLSQANEG